MGLEMGGGVEVGGRGAGMGRACGGESASAGWRWEWMVGVRG